MKMGKCNEINITPTSSEAVMNEFLKLGDQENIDINICKLLYLLYFAQVYHLTLHDSPLFEEVIVARSWGPCVKSVFTQFIDFDIHPIKNRRAKVLNLKNTEESNWDYFIPEIEDLQQKRTVENIWRALKKDTDKDLLKMARRRYEPWDLVKRYYNGDLKNPPVIRNELIKEIFKLKLESDVSK